MVVVWIGWSFYSRLFIYFFPCFISFKNVQLFFLNFSIFYISLFVIKVFANFYIFSIFSSPHLTFFFFTLCAVGCCKNEMLMAAISMQSIFAAVVLIHKVILCNFFMHFISLLAFIFIYILPSYFCYIFLQIVKFF